VTITLNSKKLK
jgi:hypothetical protein